MSNNPNRTLVCSVLFLDIEGYSKKSITEQLNLKRQFNSVLMAALSHVAIDDRIVLDTGDGAAVCFLSDPEDSLFTAINVRDGIASSDAGQTPQMRLRIGINLGPVRLLDDVNGQVNIIGDGINDAQRVMSFGEPGKILVSRSYYEVVSRLSNDYSCLFAYEGMRTDKHVREHEVYAVGISTREPPKALLAHLASVQPSLDRSATSKPMAAQTTESASGHDTSKQGRNKRIAISAITIISILGIGTYSLGRAKPLDEVSARAATSVAEQKASQAGVPAGPAAAAPLARESLALKISTASKPALAGEAALPRPKSISQKADTAGLSTKSAEPMPSQGGKKVDSGRGWLIEMRKELMVCSEKGFFPRVLCVDKARRKYCAPSHWGKVEECSTAGRSSME